MKAEDITLPDPMEIPEQSIAPMISRLASLQSILAMRLVNISVSATRQASGPDEDDEFLTATQAAKLLNVREDWLYRRALRLPFAKKLSGKTLRFSKAGLMRWRAARSLLRAAPPQSN